MRSLKTTPDGTSSVEAEDMGRPYRNLPARADKRLMGPQNRDVMEHYPRSGVRECIGQPL